MERVTLKAFERNSLGKGGARSLRRNGQIPCVLGRKGKSTHIQIPHKELVHFINSAGEEQVLVNLAFENGEAKLALIKDYQKDPIRGQLLHVDFYEVSLKENIKVNVHVFLAGTAIGVKRDGGILQTGLREVEIECLPDSIPGHVEVDISGLTIGHAVHVGDIKLPDAVKILTDKEEVLATVTASASGISEMTASEGEQKEPEIVKKGKTEER